MEPDDDNDTTAAGALEAPVAARLGNLGVGELLREAHEALIRTLTTRVIAGTASKDDIAQLRQLLKDNGMVFAGITHPDPNAPASKPPLELPDLEDPEYE